MAPNEFFNSTENLNDLVSNNGLLSNPEHLLLYRKALGHSGTFDCSIIYNTSSEILNPLGRPVRRTQVPERVRRVWNRMNAVIIGYMLEQWPDPTEALVLAGEASLDATWPLTARACRASACCTTTSWCFRWPSCGVRSVRTRATRTSPTAASTACSRHICATSTGPFSPRRWTSSGSAPRTPRSPRYR
jgi:hypothetical protein